MPTITIKTEYVEKMKQLGCYDKWLTNVKSQFGEYGHLFAEVTSFYQCISKPLAWIHTPEGAFYWQNIAHKFD